MIQRKQAGLRGPCRGLETSRRSVSASGDEAAAAAARRRPALRSGGCMETHAGPRPFLLLLISIFISITACAHWKPVTATHSFPVLQVFPPEENSRSTESRFCSSSEVQMSRFTSKPHAGLCLCVLTLMGPESEPLT